MECPTGRIFAPKVTQVKSSAIFTQFIVINTTFSPCLTSTSSLILCIFRDKVLTVYGRQTTLHYLHQNTMSTPATGLSTGDTTHTATASGSSQTPLEVLQQIDFMPHVQALVSKLINGQISVKDADNESGAVKVRIAKAKAALAEMDGLDETIHSRQAKIVSLDKQIQKKLELLKSFKQMAEAEGFDLSDEVKSEVKNEDVKMEDTKKEESTTTEAPLAGTTKEVPENAIEEDVEMS